MYDVAVIGAGPAGCHAARMLAVQGKRVLLLDKHGFPRWKPCAGGITVKTAPYLPSELHRCFERTMRGAYLSFGDHLTRIVIDGTLGWMVHREHFDEAHLALAASQPGVDARTDTPAETLREGPDKVEIVAGNTAFEARVVIGADGVNGVVSRGFPGHAERRLGFAFEGEAHFPQNAFAVDEAWFDFKRFPRGYGWIFPKQAHYSIGGFVREQSAPGIRARYDAFCADEPALTGCSTYRSKGYRIPQGGGKRPLNTGRMVLVGDAADLVDPLSGEGIYYAFRSAHLAVQSVMDFLDRGIPLFHYTHRIDAIRHDFRYARHLSALVEAYPHLAFHLLFKNPMACRWFTEVLAGRRTYGSVWRDLLLHGWRLPFGLKRGRYREFAIRL